MSREHASERIIDGYARGGADLTADEVWAVEAHLETCRGCRDRLSATVEAEVPAVAALVDSVWSGLEPRLAVTATTLSIVVVFVPIAFIGGMAGQWFKPFGLTIASSVLVSLFVSFSLDPMLSAYWRDRHGPRRRGLHAEETLEEVPFFDGRWWWFEAALGDLAAGIGGGADVGTRFRGVHIQPCLGSLASGVRFLFGGGKSDVAGLVFGQRLDGQERPGIARRRQGLHDRAARTWVVNRTTREPIRAPIGARLHTLSGAPAELKITEHPHIRKRRMRARR